MVAKLDPAADTLPKLVFRNARTMPDAIAMRRKSMGIWLPIKWSESATQVRRMAAGLIATGVDDRVCCALIGDNEPELFWAEYAIQSAGKTAVCLYPDITAEELLVTLRDCQAGIAFAEDQEQCDKLLSVAPQAGLRMIVYWDERGMADYDDPRILSMTELCERGDALLRANSKAVEEIVERGKADDLAVIIYTSGTTGRPKGVMGSHRYLLDCADRWRKVLEPRPHCNYVSYISPAWATEQYLGLSLGVALPMTVNFPEEPETVTSDMREIGAEFLFFSPRQWEAILSSTEARMRDATGPVRSIYRWGMAALAEGSRGPSTWWSRVKTSVANFIVGRAVRDRLGFTYLRTAVNSGSTLSPEVFALFKALGVSLRNVYGFTEIGIVTATRDSDPRDTVGSMLTSDYGAEPLELRICDDEIQVRGGVVFDGYFGNDALTAERYAEDGWIHSGDAGRIDEQGRLIYLDRLDDLRRLSTGETIAPQFIETRVRLSPFIRDAIVVGHGRIAPAVLIDVDMSMVGKWAEERNITFTSQIDLSQHQEVGGLIEGELRAINDSLPDSCRIWRFANLFKPFDADEGELTRSRKLRRAVVESKYADLIDALYGSGEAVRTSIEMKLQDGRVRTLTENVRIWAVEDARPHLPRPAAKMAAAADQPA